MSDFKGRQVLITGPTKGIGKELAGLFASEGSSLILVSRDRGALDKLAADLSARFGVRCEVIARDLSLAGSHEELVSDVHRLGLEVDVLVNNAGYGVYGKFHEEDILPQMGMIQLHVTLPTYLTHAFLPGMLRRGSGGILNVASTGAFQPVPIENVYCATKAYLLHFSEALAEEVRPGPVKVTCLCPGPTQTEFFDQPLMKMSMPFKANRMDAPTVARMGFEGFKQGKPLVITGLMNRVMTSAVRLAPRTIVVRAARKFVEKKNPSQFPNA